MNEITEIALIKQSMDTLNKNFEDMKEANLLAHREMKDMFEKAMAEKASKWVEDAVRWCIYLVAGIVITSIVYLVVKKY